MATTDCHETGKNVLQKETMQCTSVCPGSPNYILVVIYIESASTEFHTIPGVVYTALLFAKLTNHKYHT